MIAMKSPTKVNASPPNNGSGARKLVQARLPFKTLSGSTPTITVVDSITPQLTENRKRKLSSTPQSDGVPAAKVNKKSVVKNASYSENADDNDGIVATIDLSANESMEASVEFNIAKVNKENRLAESTKTNGSDADDDKVADNNDNDGVDDDDNSKENSILVGSENEAINDSDLQKPVEASDDDVVDVKSPKAKKSLDMNVSRGESIGLRKSTRIRNDGFTIKLPVSKKAKDASKKAKRANKSSDGNSSGDNSAGERINKKANKSSTEDASIVGTAPNATSSALSENAESTDANSSLMDVSTSSAFDSPVRSSLNSSAISAANTPIQNLTPRQLLRKAESEKKQLEKERARVEREDKLRKEREEKEEQRRREKDERKKEREDKLRKEREEKEEQRRREKEERDRKKQAELDEKEKQRERERDEKERKRLAELEAKKRKEEQKEEERRQKEAQKEEERRKREELKEDERRKKEEEKRLREEEKRQKEEADKLKYRKTAAAFAKFFVPKKDGSKGDKETEENADDEQISNFKPFRIKEDMKVAPVIRRMLQSNEKGTFDKQLFSNISVNGLYLKQLKQGKRVPYKFEKTWLPIDDERKQPNDDDDVQVLDEFGEEIVDDQPVKQIYRAKYFKFNENRRPAYYGTWRKKSTTLGPRNPFGKDKIFDYEIDSDDEWEEEEPGESLEMSDEEGDKESEDDYDIDNEFFVPHGHLSDEELQDDDLDDNSPEAQKAKLKIAQKEFDDECKKKTGKLKPRVIGLVWQNADGTKPNDCSAGTWDYLCDRSCIYTANSVVLRSDVADTDLDDGDKNKRIKMTDDAIPDLIRLLHGNRNNCKFLISEFRAFMAKQNEADNGNRREFSEASIKTRIRELSEKTVCMEAGPMYNKMCWLVSAEKRTEYGVNNLALPNSWTYVLKPKIDVDKDKDGDLNEDADSKGAISESVTSASVKLASSKPSAFNIARYIRPLTEDEKKKQFGSLQLRTASPTNVPTGESTSIPPAATEPKGKKTSPSSRKLGAQNSKKRVNLLMSGPRGEDFSPNTKNTIVSHFLNAAKRKKENEERLANGATSNNDKDVIVID